MVSKTVELEIKYSKLRKKKIEQFNKIDEKLNKKWLSLKAFGPESKKLMTQMSKHRKKKIKFIRDSQRLLLQQKFTELSRLF